MFRKYIYKFKKRQEIFFINVGSFEGNERKIFRWDRIKILWRRYLLRCQLLLSFLIVLYNNLQYAN